MGFKATNVIPQIAYQKTRGAAAQLKLNCTELVGQMAASGATYTVLRDTYMLLYNADAQFAQLAATPGLADYAIAQEADEAYDVAAEFTAMRAAIAAAIAWMNANVPTAVTAVSPANWPSTSNMIATAFTAAQTAPLRTLLQSVAGSIE